MPARALANQNPTDCTRRWLWRGLLFLAFWALVLLAFAHQLVFGAEFAWTQALRGALHDWLPWVLLSPAVIWLALRFPLERGMLRWSVPVHAVGCAAAVLACSAISLQLLPRLRPRQVMLHMHEGPPPREPGRPPGPGGPAIGDFERRERQIASLHGRGPHLSIEGRARRFWAVALWSRSRVNAPVYWVIVSVAHAFSFYRRAQERDRRALELSAGLSRAKLEALRLQLQPHFLFNTLNAISTLVHKDPDKADEMITNLGELLRVSLQVNEQEVPLRHELEVLDRYLEIEQVRLGERLRVEREIEAVTLDALVPSLVLQTLVENAIRHGIEPHSRPGVVTLRARRVGSMLELQVVDDGVGLASAGRAAERRGIGIANTESRITELYGGGGSMILREPPEGGVSVELRTPFHRSALTDTPSEDRVG